MQDLSTGYNLGALLSKLGLQPDFDRFDASGTPDAAINNFTRLHPTLKRLGVKFTSQTVSALVRKDKGAALKVLYGIKRVRCAALRPCRHRHC